MRNDHIIISQIIEPGSRVLDLGCGSGDLLALLEKNGIKGQGVELDEAKIYECVAKGVSVFHMDIDSGLEGYPDQAFEYVILNQSLQEVRNIGIVITESLRVGRRVIIGLPNFAHYAARFRLFFTGKAPMTPSLPYDWSDTPNVRFMSIKDFRRFCKSKGLRIIREIPLDLHHQARILPNLFAVNTIYLIEKAR